MSRRHSPRGAREGHCGAIRQVVGNERGGILAFVAVSLVVTLGMAGLAIDSARAYVLRAHLARSVDAAALAAAREIRSGHQAAEDRARAVAEVNGVVGGTVGTTLDFQFGQTKEGEQTVYVEAAKPMPVTFLKVLGFDQIRVRAAATAAVPPVDLVLVLDQSGSMERELCGNSTTEKAWDCLQDAAKNFVDHFDDGIDQLGLVSFQLRGTDRHQVSHGFTKDVKDAIDAAQANGDTNPGEALRLALGQVQSPSLRPRSAKAVVFFTDGRPTAFRGDIGGVDRMMAVGVTRNNGRMRGYFDNPDQLPTDRSASADGCGGALTCFGWTEPTIRQQATDNGTAMADAIRSENVILYTIGLGNPNQSNPILTPDMDWLAMLANEDGRTNSNQPRGRALFAESGADLEEVFDLVARDLLVRLAR